MEHPEHSQSLSSAAGAGLWPGHDDCFAFYLKVNVSSPTLQMTCPGVLPVNVCTNREDSKDLSDGRQNIGIVPLRSLYHRKQHR